MRVPDRLSFLQPFVDAAVLGPADVHVTETLMRNAGIEGTGIKTKNIALAVALAVRAPQHGHVCVDLSNVAEVVVADTRVLDHEDGTVDPLAGLKWPEVGKWTKQLSTATTLVRGANSLGLAEMDRTALVLEGTQLYLDRYHIYERDVAQALRDRAKQDNRTPTIGQPDAVDKLFGTDAGDKQRAAALAIGSHALTVVVGGPGTGKTRTIARALAAEISAANAAGSEMRVALAAPTGKAAQRMGEAIATEAQSDELDANVAAAITAVEPSTIHRLLGYKNGIQFRHDSSRPIPFDLVIIDEVSMVSLPLMARLLDAVSPTTRLVLVGDPFQLASVEAGAVLGDIVAGTRMQDSVVTLAKVHRFAEASGIAQFADAVAAGDSQTALELLDSQGDLELVHPGDDKAKAKIERLASKNAAEIVKAAVNGDGQLALDKSTELKVLCATRHGPQGLRTWQNRIEQLTADATSRSMSGRWYVGRPVIVTKNDYLNQLANGDVGVVINTEDGLRVQMNTNDKRQLSPSQLESPETWWAMTVHKSQGSEFDHVIVSLPKPPMPILTRELLYTAVTRAKSQLTICASVESLRTAIETPVSRTSGLRVLLS